MFVLSCIDKPDSHALRAANRQAHMTYVSTHPAFRLGGPYLDDEDRAVGSMIIVETEDEAAALAISQADPYRLADLYARVDIRGWRHVAGAIPNGSTA
jgi:uncharacterized protein YciI